MIWAVLLVLFAAGSLWRTVLFWEWLTGCALLGVPLGIAAGEWGTAAASLLFFAGCCWHWSRVA